MKNVTINVDAQYYLRYDEKSEEFKAALESYKELIDSNGDVESMLCHVVHSLMHRGWRGLVEGVGYVSCGMFYKPTDWCGIHVEDGNPVFEYDVV